MRKSLICVRLTRQLAARASLSTSSALPLRISMLLSRSPRRPGYMAPHAGAHRAAPRALPAAFERRCRRACARHAHRLSGGPVEAAPTATRHDGGGGRRRRRAARVCGCNDRGRDRAPGAAGGFVARVLRSQVQRACLHTQPHRRRQRASAAAAHTRVRAPLLPQQWGLTTSAVAQKLKPHAPPPPPHPLPGRVCGAPGPG